MAYTPINWQDLPGTVTPATSENLRHMDDGIEAAHNDIENLQSNIITLSSNDTQSIVSGDNRTIINLPNLIAQVGNKLSYGNNRITIGTGVNYVKVSGAINGNTQSRAWTSIMHYDKNGNRIDKQDCLGYSGTDYYNTWNFPTKCVPVNEGDYFEMSISGNANININSAISNLNATYMTVEVVK